jgi:hypothetical protein
MANRAVSGSKSVNLLQNGPAVVAALLLVDSLHYIWLIAE